MLHFDKDDFQDKQFPFIIRVDTIHENFPVHTHGFTELVVILDGIASQVINNRVYDVNPGDVYLFSENVSHGFVHVNALRLCNIMFDPDKLLLPLFDLSSIEGYHALFTLDPYWRKTHLFRNRMRLDDKGLGHIIQLIDQMKGEYNGRQPGYRNRLTLLLNDMIIFLSRSYYAAHKEKTGLISRLSKAITYMENNYARPIQITELASNTNLSERQFNRIFKTTLNQNPVGFLRAIRLRHACLLLKETNYSIKRIASMCGFAEPDYFSRVFRKEMKINATAYRKQAKKIV